MKKVHRVKVKNHGWIGLIFLGNGALAAVSLTLGLISPYLLFISFIFFTVVMINIIYSIRTANAAYLVTALHYTVCTLLFLSAVFRSHQWVQAMQIIFVFTLFCLLFTGLSRKVKWRNREVLEMAAHPVKEITDGFTNRPRPVGKAVFSRDELRGFARYMLKKLIAIPCEEEGRIVFVIPGNHFAHIMNFIRDDSHETHVAFHFDGNVSSHISKKDYLRFKDQLSYDQLCSSLGNLFLEFIDLYKREEQTRIIDRMNEYKFNPFFGGIIGF